MLRNPNAASSSQVPYRDLRLLKVYGKMVNNTVRGLISLRIGENEGISNPSTRLQDIFPQIKFKNVTEFGPRPEYYFGYNPVEDQYKVLAIDQDFWRAEWSMDTYHLPQSAASLNFKVMETFHNCYFASPGRKKLAKKVNFIRRFKRVALGRKSIFCPNHIPLDLQIETLLRLPVKSLLRFRCVSKLWSSIITSQGFQKQHMNNTASSSPRLLIAFRDFHENKFMFVSLATPNASSSFSCRVPFRDLSLHKVQGQLLNNTVPGLICLESRGNVGLCNPSTKQFHIFPQIKFKGRPEFYPLPKLFFGYDNVEDQYKVLAIDTIPKRKEHKVLVVGGERGWRDVSHVICSHSAVTSESELCMNGSIYYGALLYEPTVFRKSVIVSFNVRLETFNIIQVPSKLVPVGDQRGLTDKTLINYRGKIGVVETPREGCFRIWVVEDADKEEWSVNTYHLPQSVAGLDFNVMKTFSTGEICLVPKELPDQFCLFYYSLKTNSIRSVTIEGLPITKLKRVKYLYVTVSDHYESLMSLGT